MDYIVNKNGVQILIEADPAAIKKQVVEQYKQMRKEKSYLRSRCQLRQVWQDRIFPDLKVGDIILR